MGVLDESLGGLGGISGLLADDSNTTLLVGEDTNGLVISTLVFALVRRLSLIFVVWHASMMYLGVDETSVLFENKSVPNVSQHPSLPELPYQWHIACPWDPYLSAVLVGKVQGVVGELNAAIAVALGEEAVVVSYPAPNWLTYDFSLPWELK